MTEAATQQPNGQPDMNGAPTPAPEVKAAEGEALSAKLAVLAKKEREIQRARQALKAEQDALKSKAQEYESSYIPKSLLQERLTKDPLGFLNEHGLSYDQLTNLALNQPDPTTQRLQAKIDQLEAKLGKFETSQEDQQKSAYNQALTQIRTETKLLVDSDPEFETIKAMDASDAVVELIEETFKQKNILMSTQEAAREVESYLLDQALKMSSLNKVKQKLTPPAAPAEEKSLEQAKSQPMKTLTNAIGASSTQRLSEKQRVERAILAFKGQLQT